jgi:hypothetical protein
VSQEPVALVASLIPSQAQDLVAVYTQDYLQVFPKARPLKAIIKENSKIMDHPLETGATVVDHRIINPVEIELTMVLSSFDYRDTYQQIKKLYLDGELLIVQTRSDTYTNQIIESIPHDESPDFFDAITLSLSTREVQFAVAETSFIPSDPVNESTVERSTIQPEDATEGEENKTIAQSIASIF